MRGISLARVAGASIAVVVLGLGMAGGVAAASTAKGPDGVNLHKTMAFDAVVVTFVPGYSAAPVTLPTGCWLPVTDAFMSVSGNLQGHAHPNKNGFWSTSTFTGSASVQPIVFETTAPVKATPSTPTSNTTVTTTLSNSYATGHLTVWDGASVNQKTVVEHATLTFKGNQWTGAPVSMSGSYELTFTHVVYKVTGTTVTITFTASTLASFHATLSC